MRCQGQNGGGEEGRSAAFPSPLFTFLSPFAQDTREGRATLNNSSLRKGLSPAPLASLQQRRKQLASGVAQRVRYWLFRKRKWSQEGSLERPDDAAVIPCSLVRFC